MPDVPNPRPGAADRLREMLGAGSPVAAAGCHDALSARLAEAAGFPAVHLSGALVSATALGLPDLGFAGATDMLDALRRVTAGTGLPVVADADTGYGDPPQVAETVRRYEREGAAALHLEDQVQPKRCGHTPGVRLVELPVALARLRAAVAARDRVVVIARTDALNAAGPDEALRRAAAFAGAGADAIMVEGAVDAAMLGRVREAAGGLPLVVNCSAAGPAADPLDVLGEAGAGLVLYPVTAALAGAAAMREVYGAILRDGRAPGPAMTWPELNDLLGLPALNERFADPAG